MEKPASAGILAHAQEILPGMPRCLLEHSGGEPEGTARATVGQSHPLLTVNLLPFAAG